MRTLERIQAVALKEWRLNQRFALEYFASNIISPLKSAVLMYFLYRGLLPASQNGLGILNSGNFQFYVLIGTTCHGLFVSSLLTFRFKMLTEKYWQTFTATLVSPASILEVITGFILGSVAIHIVFGTMILGVVCFLAKVTFVNYLISLFCLWLVTLLGFGFGLVGATLSLVWEGKTFVFDYIIQLLMFLSCFYYPVETLPAFLHPVVKMLPMYQVTHLVQYLFLVGTPEALGLSLAYLTTVSLVILCLPAMFLDYSVKKFGIVGY